MLEDAQASRALWGGFLSRTLTAAAADDSSSSSSSSDDDDDEEKEEEEGGQETLPLDAAAKAALLLRSGQQLAVLTTTAGGGFPFALIDRGPLRLPPSVGAVLAAYRAHFTATHISGAGGRRLQVLPRAGSVVLTDGATGHDFVVSPTQAAALLVLGAQREGRAVLSTLAQVLGLQDDGAFLRRELEALSRPQAPLLLPSPPPPSLSSASSSSSAAVASASYALNDAFLHGQPQGGVTVLLPASSMGALAGGVSMSSGGAGLSDTELEEQLSKVTRLQEPREGTESIAS
jgi:hypothetical protein